MTVATPQQSKIENQKSKITLPLAALLTGTAAFLAIAADLHFHGALQQLDLPIRQFLHNHSNPFLVIACSALSFLGQFEVLLPIGLAGGIYLLYKRRLFPLLVWAIALLGSIVINESLKNIFQVPRPDRYTYFVWTKPNPGYSFPSGHTMGVTIVAGTILLLANHLRLISRKTTLFATLAVIALSLAVAFSLMYMGVHSLTDILSALAISVAWLGAITLLLRRTPSSLPIH